MEENVITITPKKPCVIACAEFSGNITDMPHDAILALKARRPEVYAKLFKETII